MLQLQLLPQKLQLLPQKNTCCSGSRTACEASNFTRAADQLQDRMFGVAATASGSREGQVQEYADTIHWETFSLKNLTSEQRYTGVPTH